jgi:lysozyme family protein
MPTNAVIDNILRREGDRYTNRAADRGGPTKYGVTLATLSEWRGKACTAKDVEDLGETEAREIYREEYIIRPGFLGIENESVRALTVDCGVNHGVSRAVKMLQQAAHVFPDGIFGSNTRTAVNRMTAAVLYRRLIAERVRFYGQIIAKDPELARVRIAGYDQLQAFNAGGWLNRAAEFIEVNL